MDSISFLYFDDIDRRDVDDENNWKILIEKGNGTFILKKMPYIVTKSFKEFQKEIGPVIYLLDPNIDKSLLKKYSSKVMYLELENFDNLSWHIVASYDEDSICVKNTSIAKKTYESSFRFVRIKDIHSGNKLDKEEIYFLKLNSDNTVSILPAPVNLKRGISSYEVKNEGILVIPIEDDYTYDESKVIKLEGTEDVGKYRIVSSLEKPKQKVKRSELK